MNMLFRTLLVASMLLIPLSIGWFFLWIDKHRSKSVTNPRCLFALDTAVLTSDGQRYSGRIEVFLDYLEILGRGPRLLVRVDLALITAVQFQDRTIDGVPMAGLGIVTPDARYQFFDVGFLIPRKLRRAAETISSLHNERHPGNYIRVSDLSLDRLTPSNIVH